jgi:putative acetyltransferase
VTSLSLQIEVDDITRPAVLALLNEHLANMYALSPPESVHALDVSRLQAPDITFWTAWQDGVLMGCGALKELTPEHAEVKSMRTPQALRGRGAGRALMQHIVQVARRRGYRRLSLETGSQIEFEPAQKLYESFGFGRCGPFGSYKEDPYSVYMTVTLDPASPAPT